MESLKELYRVGPGPSSTHTLGVQRACRYYKERYRQYVDFIVELYGSLGLTGHGHMTDAIIQQVFGPEHVVIKFYRESYLEANTMVFHTVKDGALGNEMIIFSTGGGAIAVKDQPPLADPNVYPDDHMTAILELCHQHHWSLSDYAFNYDHSLKTYLSVILQRMLEMIKNGLGQSGELPGDLHLTKVAKRLYGQATSCDDPAERQRLLITAYAYAAMEENACGHNVVTAPTLGSCGVVSAMVMHHYENGMARERLVNGLAIAGLFGDIVKSRATIAGAQGGCQAEIGTACAMASAMNAYLLGLSNKLISYAAEIGMEHNLGLTCDPVGGYVQIPCIERNGLAALRSVDAAIYAKHLGTLRDNRVSFDMIVDTMSYTGSKLARELRETSLGGLAKVLPVGDQGGQDED